MRTILSDVQEHRDSARRISKRINTELLKFDYTIGRDGSVTKNKIVRAIIENQISDNPSTDYASMNSLGIPKDTRPIIRDQYNLYDFHREMASSYEKTLMSKTK